MSVVTNLLRSLATCLLPVVVLAAVGCSSFTIGDGLQLRVTMTDERTPLEAAELGAIYIEDRTDGPNLRVGIRSDHTWTIATEIEPGWFTLGMRSGKIENGVAIDFPVELLNGNSEQIHTEGDIRAWLGGREVAHSTADDTAPELAE